MCALVKGSNVRRHFLCGPYIINTFVISFLYFSNDSEWKKHVDMSTNITNVKVRIKSIRKYIYNLHTCIAVSYPYPFIRSIYSHIRSI